MDSLNDDELRAEYRRAQLMGALADNAGEADASALFASVTRACEVELTARNLTS